MQTRSTHIIIKKVLKAVILLSFSAVVLAQAPVQEKTPSVGNPAVPARPSQTPQTLGEDETKTLYGLQGVLVETLDGRTVAAQSVNQALNPASTVKLATALVALKTLGPQHRFATGVWSDGVLDKASGAIDGNLYITGRDPSFHYEHAVVLARELNNLGIKKVTGSLVVSPGFTMNFSSSARQSGEQLRDTLDSTLRSAAAIKAWTYERTALNDQASLASIPSVAVTGEVSVAPALPSARLLLTQRSSKLVDILKVLLCYSNNFMAERIGETLGGPESVRRELVTSLGIAPDDLRISSLSGLGVNRITPQVMMKIFRSLRDELRKSKLSPSDIMPVAGTDPGTLQDRFAGLPWRGSVIAKTGTLARTDGGASALVGQMQAANGEVLLFVIMNQRGNVLRFRENQDYFVMQVQNSRGGPKAFDYRPRMLTMELSDTESTFASEEGYGLKSKSRLSSP
jgi:D-alanyl-D-alanine carboxypeptidase/D-alanyl-D-alanine-endopeptidase (penicillin-binding protein 4)